MELPSLHSLAPAHMSIRQSPKAIVPANTMRVHKGDFVGMGFAMKDAFLEARGIQPPTATERSVIPKTTNGDALAIARYWTIASWRYGNNHFDQSEAKRWITYAQILTKRARGEPATLTYSDNHRFWREVGAVAIRLNAIGAKPSQWTYAWEAITESAAELPGTLANAFFPSTKTLITGALIVIGTVALIKVIK